MDTYLHARAKSQKKPQQEEKLKKKVFIPNRLIEQERKATGVERRGHNLYYLFYPAWTRLVILVAKRRL